MAYCPGYNPVAREWSYGKIVSFYKITPVFRTLCVFRPLNPYSPRKFITNRFFIVRPIHPCAGLPVTHCGSKVMAHCRITHHTSPSFFGGLSHKYIEFFPEKLFVDLPPPVRLHPIDGIVATKMGAHVMCTTLVAASCCCW